MSFNQSFELSGLSTGGIAVPTAGTYEIKGKIQLPRIAAGSTQVSAVVATITNQTGPVTLYTSIAGSDGFKVDALCAAGDVLQVALTSVNAIDAVLNNIKCQ